MKAPLIAVLAAVALAGCQSTASCPPLTEYTPEKQAKVAKQLRDQHGSDLADFIVDYGKLRDACRLKVSAPPYETFKRMFRR